MNIDWRSALLTLAALAVAGALGAVATLFFGLYNVSFRVGHLPGVSWVLHTTFQNSVDLRAKPLVTAPGNPGRPGRGGARGPIITMLPAGTAIPPRDRRGPRRCAP